MKNISYSALFITATIVLINYVSCSFVYTTSYIVNNRCDQEVMIYFETVLGEIDSVPIPRKNSKPFLITYDDFTDISHFDSLHIKSTAQEFFKEDLLDMEQWQSKEKRYSKEWIIKVKDKNFN